MHPTNISKSIVELNKTVLKALDSKGKLLARRQTKSVKDRIATLDHDIKKNQKYISSLHTKNLPWTPTGNYDRFLEINTRIGNTARDRLTLAGLKKTKSRADKIEQLSRNIKSLETERRDIVRHALDFKQRVTVVFHFVSKDKENKEHRWTPVVKHGVGYDVDSMVDDIKRDLLNDLEEYVHLVDGGNLISALHKIFVGKDKSGRVFVGTNGNPWNSVDITHAPYYDAIPNMLVNASDPVSISGLTSINHKFGCHVGAIKYYDKITTDVQVQRQFALITGGIAIEEDPDDVIDIEYEFEDIQAGVTRDQFIEYLNKYFSHKNWSVGSLLGERKYHKVNKKATKHFTLVNNHVYCGIPEKKQIDVRGKTDCVIELNNEDDLEFAMDDPNMLYYVRGDLNKVYDLIRTKYNVLADVSCGESGINMIGFNTNVFVDYDDYYERKSMYDKLSGLYSKSHSFAAGFKNQSWSTLAMAELNSRGVTLYESFDLPDTRDKLRQYKSRPFIGFINDMKMYESDLRCYDLKKCYAQVCILNALGRVGIFRVDENFEIVDDTNRNLIISLVIDDNDSYVGELILNSFMYLGITIPAMTWPSYFVKMMIENDVINGSQIMYHRRAHEYDTMESIAEYVKYILVNHGDNGKYMYTRLFGMLGVNTSTNYESFITTDIGLSATSIEHGYSTSNIVDGLYLSTKRSESQILSNYNSYFRFIVCGSIMKLFELVDGIKSIAANCNVLSARVDGVYVENVNVHEHEAICEFLSRKWGFDGTDYVFGQPEEVVPHCVIKQPMEVEEFESVFDISTENKQLVLSDAGLGKTVFIAETVKQLQGNILMATFTNLLRKDLNDIALANKDKSIKVMNFNQLLIRYQKGKLRNKYDHIIVDEISTCGHRSLEPIIYLINRNPSCGVIFCGDMKQLGSVGERTVNYTTDALKAMFGVHHKITWHDKARHDRATYDVLMDFYNSGMLGEELLSRVVTSYDKPCLNNIAARNALCGEISKRQIELHVKAGLAIDKPWYNTANTKDRINGDLFDDIEVAKRKIPSSDLIHRSCLTPWRVQGKTMHGDVVIYQSELMSLNGLYSAMARCKRIENLYIIGDKLSLTLKSWDEHEPSWKTERASESSMKHYAVYLIRDQPNTQLYVGITTCNSFSDDDICNGINRRLEQHKLEKEFSDEVNITEICHLKARENSLKIELTETHWVQHYQAECTREGSEYHTWKIMNKLLLKKIEDPTEDTWEPVIAAPVADVILSELFTNNHRVGLALFKLPQLIITDSKITWRYMRRDGQVLYEKTRFKSVKKVKQDNTEAATKLVVSKIVKFIETRGREIDSIKDKLIEMNLL